MEDVFDAYHRRWSIEEVNRSFKESRLWGVRMEDVRAQSLRGVQTLVLLATIYFGYLVTLRNRAASQLAVVATRAVAIGADEAMDPSCRLVRWMGQLLDDVPRRSLRAWRQRA